MTVDQLIAALQKLSAEGHGDQDVLVHDAESLSKGDLFGTGCVASASTYTVKEAGKAYDVVMLATTA